MSESEFQYPVELGDKEAILKCCVDYDYCTDYGASATLTQVLLEGWDVLPLMDKALRDEIEEHGLLDAMDRAKELREMRGDRLRDLRKDREID